MGLPSERTTAAQVVLTEVHGVTVNLTDLSCCGNRPSGRLFFFFGLPDGDFEIKLLKFNVIGVPIIFYGFI